MGGSHAVWIIVIVLVSGVFLILFGVAIYCSCRKWEMRQLEGMLFTHSPTQAFIEIIILCYILIYMSLWCTHIYQRFMELEVFHPQERDNGYSAVAEGNELIKMYSQIDYSNQTTNHSQCNGESEPLNPVDLPTSGRIRLTLEVMHAFEPSF